MEVGSASVAFLCACWFMLFQQDFFFTYNHVGGIVMILGVVFCLLSYIKGNSYKAAWGALGFVFALCLIKIDFGLAALAVCAITVGVCDRVRRIPIATAKKIFYTFAFIGLPLLLFIVYWSLLKGLSIPEIRQCFPYMEGDQPSATARWTEITTFFQMTFQTIKSNWTNFTFAVIINASALRCLYLVCKKQTAGIPKNYFSVVFEHAFSFLPC